ncbi:MAG: hypothetical protein WDN49_11435 [Acetobacteraceae bacterium]
MQFATRAVTAREYCLVRIRSTDGVEGVRILLRGQHLRPPPGCCRHGPAGPAPGGRGLAPGGGSMAEMYQEALLQGRVGAVMRALSALDIALWT